MNSEGLSEAKVALKQFLQQNLNCSETELENILSFWHEEVFDKQALLIEQGSVSSWFYFVSKGCLRLFSITPDGSEKTNHISTENTIITGLSSFISGDDSTEILEAVEDSTVTAIHRADFYKLVDAVAPWADFYRTILETAYLTKVRRIDSLVSLTATERYKLLVKSNPTIPLRIPNNILASYLDIDQSTLSRIKKRLANV